MMSSPGSYVGAELLSNGSGGLKTLSDVDQHQKFDIHFHQRFYFLKAVIWAEIRRKITGLVHSG